MSQDPNAKVDLVPLQGKTPQEPLDSSSETPPTFREMAPAIEFCFWVVVFLAPFLRWVNGAAVTDDQFYIQVTLTSLAVAGAVSLRIYNWRSAKKLI